MTRTPKFALTMLLLGLPLGCRSSPERLELPREPLAQLEQTLGYPHGGWWHNPPELQRVRLAARHILVTHSGVSGARALLGTLLWPGARSRAEAIRRAVAIARRAAARPESFERLAREYSDDRASAQVGGALGVFAPTDVPRAMVDALGVLGEQGVSHAFESELGVHVVQRLAVGKPKRLSYARIVVAHEGVRAAGVASARTRRAAAERATQLANELSASPQRFAEVVGAYSDAADKVRAGDQGSYDTHEFGAPALLLQIVSGLEAGKVSEPIETEAGFEILQRTPERARTRYAFTALTLPYVGSGASLLGATATEAEARAAGEQILQAIHAGLGFDRARTELCQPPRCQPYEFVETQGRGAPELERILLALPSGAVADALVPTPVGFQIARREAAPAPEPALALRFDLPAAPTLEEMINASHPAELGAATRRIGKETVAALEIEDARVLTLFEELAASFEASTPGQRLAEMAEMRMKLRQLVGESDAARIGAFVRSGIGSTSTGAPASTHVAARP